MLKLKDGVTGFIYCSINGYVKSAITKPILGEVITSGDDVFIDNENVNELFEIKSQEQLEQSDEGLNDVLVWVNM